MFGAAADVVLNDDDDWNHRHNRKVFHKYAVDYSLMSHIDLVDRMNVFVVFDSSFRSNRNGQAISNAVSDMKMDNHRLYHCDCNDYYNLVACEVEFGVGDRGMFLYVLHNHLIASMGDMVAHIYHNSYLKPYSSLLLAQVVHQLDHVLLLRRYVQKADHLSYFYS